PVVDIGSRSIRGCSQNRTRSYPLPFDVLPPIPKPGESEQLPVVHFKAVRLLRCSVSLPLIERISGNQATPILQRVAKSRLRGCCFRASVDHSRRAGRGVQALLETGP